MSRDGWMKKRANTGDDNGWAERGGYMAAKVSKLDEQFRLDAPREKQKEGACTGIFRGVAIYVNGYTDPSADELRRLMMLHGGQFHVYYSRSKTTHIIANNLPNCKIQELRGEKVIRPDWITDSIKAGHLLPYLKYELYAKQKGALFPAVSLRQTREVLGSSHGPLHPKLHLPQQKIPLSVPHRRDSPSLGHQNNSVPVSVCVESLPLPGQHSSKAGPLTPSATGHLISDSRHGDATTNSQHAKHPSKSTPSTRCKGEELQINGTSPISLDHQSHSKTLKIQERKKDSPCSKEPHLTNGHAHRVNGALKPVNLAVEREPEPRPSDRDRSKHVVSGSLEKPQSPVKRCQSRSDPYEFPHSPSKQADVSPGVAERSSAKEAEPPKPHPPCPNAAKVSHTTAQVSEKSEGNQSKSHSHPPVRLNGSHHDALTPRPDLFLPPPTESDRRDDPPPGTSAWLLEQTGSLISEYYSHSRLHQISTWRISFSEYINDLHHKRKGAGSVSLTGKDRLRRTAASRASDSQGASSPGGVKSCILHVDMDCFFVSVGIRHRPDLQGKPVAVTSNRGQARVAARPGANAQAELQYYQRRHAGPQTEREDDILHTTPSSVTDSPDPCANGVDSDLTALSMAEIASCSYEARQAGVKNGMFFGKAKQLCPSLQPVPYDFEAYKEVALSMYETLASYTHDIEALSCDEALVDASALLAELGISAVDLARAIRADIQEKTGCSASVGIGSNILLARLATRRAKPNGQYLLKSEEVDDFIRDLPVTRLPGVGRVMSAKLSAMGVSSCGDLQQVSLSQLQKKFGPRTGQTLFRFCRGLDERPVRCEKDRKSVSAEMNYNIRFTKVEEAECFLTNLSMEVQKRLQEAGLRGRRVTLKVMVRKAGAPVESAKYGGHGVCDNLARTVMLAQSTDSGQLIASTVIKLLHAMQLQVQDLRGIGIQVQLLDGNRTQGQESRGPRSSSIKEMLFGSGPGARTRNKEPVTEQTLPAAASTSSLPLSPAEPVPGTSKEQPGYRPTPKQSRTRLSFTIEVPSPSQVDRSVLEALPPEMKEQVEQSWAKRDRGPNHCHSPGPQISSPLVCPASPPRPAPSTLPAGKLVLQIPNQPNEPGIVLELPNFSQVDPDVFAALPKELQEELKSAYNRSTNVQAQVKPAEPKNSLLQLKQPATGTGIGRVKRRYKKKNVVSPLKKGASPLKRQLTNSPAKTITPSVRSKELSTIPKMENDPSTPTPDVTQVVVQPPPRPVPTLAGAFDLPDIKALLREWVTTITDPMEEDILQVVKYCTDLIEDKDLEKLDLIVKYMKRLMQQSLESVWSMAFDFILDNVQVVLQQAYGSILKIT